jgi:hypothetical protein
VSTPWGEVPLWLGLLFWGFVGYDSFALLLLVWLVGSDLLAEHRRWADVKPPRRRWWHR